MPFYVYKNNEIYGVCDTIEDAALIAENFKLVEYDVNFTDYEDYSPNNNKYILQDGEIFLNPNYEKEKVQEELELKINEIKKQLDELDLKTIRALRAGELEYLEQYEVQAVELREQLKDLESNEVSALN